MFVHEHFNLKSGLYKFNANFINTFTTTQEHTYPSRTQIQFRSLNFNISVCSFEIYISTLNNAMFIKLWTAIHIANSNRMRNALCDSCKINIQNIQNNWKRTDETEPSGKIIRRCKISDKPAKRAIRGDEKLQTFVCWLTHDTSYLWYCTCIWKNTSWNKNQTI